jgi:SAM-dependent methyltransferase
MLERARRLTAAAGLGNARYELGDIEVHRLPREHFDVVISRFGTMFFADPVAAFRNIARAARPQAQLVMLVWQSHHRNEWSTTLQTALGVDKTSSGADPFSLGTQPPHTALSKRLASLTSASRMFRSQCSTDRTSRWRWQSCAACVS